MLEVGMGKERGGVFVDKKKGDKLKSGIFQILNCQAILVIREEGVPLGIANVFLFFFFMYIYYYLCVSLY